ncbi:hypothetical protein NL676_001397 [Syzygium grande]|nr:hypothetical protein NL676_001397 [Syzygium grande]
MASDTSRASFEHVKLEEMGFGAAMFVRRGCAGEYKDRCCINIYINSNVQGVSNSILVGSEVRMGNPGVSLYFGDIKLANGHKKRRRYQRIKWSQSALHPLTSPVPATYSGVPLPDDDNDGGNTDIDNDKFPFMEALRTAENKTDPCGGPYVHVHKLPPRFSSDMLRGCKNFSPWTDIECLTDDSSVAASIFVQFYAGFDIARYLWGSDNVTVRDATALDLVEWLVKRKEWEIMGGKDHFLVAGRTAWDFRLLTDKDSDWGNKFLLLSAVRNMLALVVDSSPWDLNDLAIPYPTYS